MQRLQQAIEQKNTFMASLYLAEFFQPSLDITNHIQQVEYFIRGAFKVINKEGEVELKLKQLLDYFYGDLAFTSDENQLFSPNYNFLDKVIDYRTGIPITLSVLLCQVGRAVGLRMQEVAFPGHFLIRVEVTDQRYWYIDPLTGHRLEWQQLEHLYHVMTDEEPEALPHELLQPASCEETVIRMLHSIKASLINEGMLHQALSCSELLLQLSPDDPYERRDRGFLLHQLDCPQLALEDYHFFVEKCPSDPITELLKAHMNNIQVSEVVLH